MRLFLHIVSVVVAVVLGMGWFMSPLGFGFAKWPVDGGPLSAMNIYRLSYVIGLPLLAAVQVSSVILAFTRFHRGALPVSSISLSLLLVAVIYVMRAMA